MMPSALMTAALAVPPPVTQIQPSEPMTAELTVPPSLTKM